MARRVAVVTGAGRGIGAAIAARLIEDGWDVVGLVRRPASLAPPGMRLIACDVTDRASVTRAFAAIPALDALVNNAGLAGAHAVGPEADGAWGSILAANLTGTWHCCSAAASRLGQKGQGQKGQGQKGQGGRIVNIASVLGLRAVADQPAYVAAKHGVIGLTRSLALALAPRGITVNAVAPGWVETEMAAARLGELGLDRATASAAIPGGRFAHPAEVAGAVAFLLGPDSAAMTGAVLTLDGGAMAGV